MKILHYFLGFPPYRSGGLTKYAFDLMNAQAERGDDIYALWPGKMSFASSAVKIAKRKSVGSIANYELINPLPVPLDEGIKDFDAYMKPCDKQIYKDFLSRLNPDAIHIHTLMGLHREFVTAANELNIKTVFTTHDYFGICPKVTLYKFDSACDCDDNCRDCIACNESALSLKKIKLMQSPLYRGLKNSPVVKKLRKRHRSEFFADETPKTEPETYDNSQKADGYKKLRNYYIGILSDVDTIHFNSTVTKSVYERYFTPKDGRVLTITHKNISDHRSENTRKFDGMLNITSLAPAKPFKGYNVLRNACDELWEEGKHDFKLRLFNHAPDSRPYMTVQEDGFNYALLGEIMKQTDVLVAPSVWYETFGFTVAEALSFGVPVIVSDRLGAKDIIADGGIIVQAGNKKELKEAIASLDASKLDRLRNNIKSNVKIKDWQQFISENYELYR